MMTVFAVSYVGGIPPLGGFAAGIPVQHAFLAIAGALLTCVLLLWREGDRRKRRLSRRRRRLVLRFRGRGRADLTQDVARRAA